MKILFITPRLPYPPNRGDRVRVYNFAKALSRKHSLSLISLIQSRDEYKYRKNLQEIFDRVELTFLPSWKSGLNIAAHFFSALPFQVLYFTSRTMERKISKIVAREKLDLIYVFHLRAAQYVSEISGPYKVLDFTDAVSLLLQRLLPHAKIYLKPVYYREWLTTRRYEARIAKKFDENWLISEVDRKAIRELSPGAKICIVPNGVDLDYFVSSGAKTKAKNVLFVGYMGVESVDAVLYFYKEIFPFIQEEFPSTKFYVVGANPPRKIIELDRDENVTVTGFAEDLRGYYDNAAVMVAPMRFVVGVQNKILEAMAMEVPVVTTHFGNEGIDARHGKEIFVADDPKEFAGYVIELLKNKKLRDEIGRNARNFVKDHFTWQTVVRRIDEISEQLMQSETKARNKD